jgi:hypothetical protein
MNEKIKWRIGRQSINIRLEGVRIKKSLIVYVTWKYE